MKAKKVLFVLWLIVGMIVFGFTISHAHTAFRVEGERVNVIEAHEAYDYDLRQKMVKALKPIDFGIHQEAKVVRGDSLWQITEAFGLPGSRWPELYKANPGLPAVKKFDGKQIVRIYAGQKLNLPTNWPLNLLDERIVRLEPGVTFHEHGAPVITVSFFDQFPIFRWMLFLLLVLLITIAGMVLLNVIEDRHKAPTAPAEENNDEPDNIHIYVNNNSGHINMTVTGPDVKRSEQTFRT